MALTDKDYNEEKLQGYIDRLEYSQAADYLKEFTLSNPDKQRELDFEIRRLRGKASIIDGILSNASERDRDDIKFAIHANNGTIDDTTERGKTYSRILDRIGSNGKQRATSLRVQFDDNDKYNSFLQNMSISESDLKKRGIQIGTYNGVKNITFDKSNPDVVNLIQGLHNTKGIDPLTVGITTGRMLGHVISGMGNPGKILEEGLENLVSGFKITGLDAENHEIEDDGTAFHRLNRLYRQVSRANEIYKGAIEGDTFSTNIVTTDFMGAAHSKLYDYLKNGKIESTEYDRVKKNIDNIYTRRIINEGFASRDMFVAEDEGDTFNPIDDPKLKNQYAEILRTAANNGDRITFAAAMAGSTTGTMITITGKDEKGFIPEEGDKRKNYNAQYRIFVPNLFNDECEESFDRNTQTRAVKSYNDLVTYHGNEYLNNDYIISNVDNDGGYLSNPKMGIENQYLSRPELLKFLDESYIKDDLITLYNREYKDINRTNLSGEIGGINFGTTSKSLEQLEAEIINRSYEAAKEIVPNEKSQEYVNKVLDFYNAILDGIGYKEARHLTLDNN